jgi:hypothetical protein
MLKKLPKLDIFGWFWTILLLGSYTSMSLGYIKCSSNYFAMQYIACVGLVLYYAIKRVPTALLINLVFLVANGIGFLRCL